MIRPTSLDLRGRQSVRATFRPSEACIDAISILSTQLGIKQKKELFTGISSHFAEGKKLLSKAEEMLGSDDPIVHKLQTAMSVYKNVFDDIANFIERGKIIEEFRPE
jgi:hypothetical protein